MSIQVMIMSIQVTNVIMADVITMMTLTVQKNVIMITFVMLPHSKKCLEIK